MSLLGLRRGSRAGREAERPLQIGNGGLLRCEGTFCLLLLNAFASSVLLLSFPQDYLLSRLVSVEELQAALPCLLSVDWVSRGIALIVGTATAVLSPVEWLSLLRPEGPSATSLDANIIAHKYKKMFPKPFPLRASRTVVVAMQRLKKKQHENTSEAKEDFKQQEQQQEQGSAQQDEERWRMICTPSRMGLRWNSYSIQQQKLKTKSQPQRAATVEATTPKDAALDPIAAGKSAIASSLLGLGCTAEEQQEWVMQQVIQHVLYMADSEKTSKALARLVAASAHGGVSTCNKDRKAIAAAGESFSLDLHLLQFCVQSFFLVFSLADIFKDLHPLV